MIEQSRRKKSNAIGWSSSTAWLTSITYRLLLYQSRLYSLRSACTNFAC